MHVQYAIIMFQLLFYNSEPFAQKSIYCEIPYIYRAILLVLFVLRFRGRWCDTISYVVLQRRILFASLTWFWDVSEVSIS